MESISSLVPVASVPAFDQAFSRCRCIETWELRWTHDSHGTRHDLPPVLLREECQDVDNRDHVDHVVIETSGQPEDSDTGHFEPEYDSEELPTDDNDQLQDSETEHFEISQQPGIILSENDPNFDYCCARQYDVEADTSNVELLRSLTELLHRRVLATPRKLFQMGLVGFCLPFMARLSPTRAQQRRL